MRKWSIWLIVFLAAFFGMKFTVYASNPDTSVLEEMDLNSIDTTLEGMMGDTPFNFKDAIGKFIKGEVPFTAENVGRLIWDSMFSVLDEHRQILIQIMIIVVIAAVFTNFSNIFENGQISEISFYIIYLLLFGLLVSSFGNLTLLVTDALNNVLSFMKVLVPAYFLAIALSQGGISAAVFYEFTFLLITLVQTILIYVVIPATNIYVILSLVNYLSKEDYLSRMANLVKTGIEWVLKTMMAVVIGVQTVQCLIMPVVDSLKTTVLSKTASAIPGIGNAINSVTEMVLGSAVLIKNSVGAAALMVLVLLCLSPLVKLFICSFLYKLVAAVIQPVSDKRMIGCIHSVGEGASLLLKVLFTGMALFLITIAMVTASTSKGM